MVAWEVELCHDRVVVVGGGSGIGRATALRLAELGATVYVLGRRAHALEETASRAAGLAGRVIPLVCDARSAPDVDGCFVRIEAEGPAQALAHCAAAVNYVPARDMSPENFEEVVASTLFTAFNVIHRWAVGLLRSGLSGIGVAVTSAMAPLGTPGLAHSASGKAGIEAFIKSVAREWARDGVRVNGLGPGFFPVEKSQDLWSDDSVSGPIRAQIGLGRLGALEEIVGPMLFLLSRAASYITGEVLVVDGGYRLQPEVFPRWTYASEAGSAGPDA